MQIKARAALEEFLRRTRVILARETDEEKAQLLSRIVEVRRRLASAPPCQRPATQYPPHSACYPSGVRAGHGTARLCLLLRR